MTHPFYHRPRATDPVLPPRTSTALVWAFVAVVLVFSAVSWAGAWLMAPKRAAVSHFTILSAQADSPTVHAHSWLSLYIPKFAKQKVEVDPDHPTVKHTLASPGLVTGLNESGFLDPQTYEIDTAIPRSADIPFRSTAKQLEVDYLGRIDQSQKSIAWVKGRNHRVGINLFTIDKLHANRFAIFAQNLLGRRFKLNRATK